jgi:hypothetical protein
MGNVMSEEDNDETFLQEGFNLESPDADRVVNFGTAAPVWQNAKEQREEETRSDQGQEVAVHGGENRRSNSTVSDCSSSKSSNNDPKKMSYVQMAKMGYQELVNAIIRPPRADYKVRCAICSYLIRVRYLDHTVPDLCGHYFYSYD